MLQEGYENVEEVKYFAPKRFSLKKLNRYYFLLFFIIIFSLLLFLFVATVLAIIIKIEPDKEIIHEVLIDGRRRNYVIHFPENYDQNLTYPIVVGLHPFFLNVQKFKNDYGWNEAANKNKFVALYPIAYSREQRLDLVGWNDGMLLTDAYFDQVDDTRFIRRLISFVLIKHEIRASEFYCTGHSDGGNMCYKTAGDYPRLFYGISPVSSAVGGQIDKDSPVVVIRKPTNAVKLIHVHGVKDKIVKVQGGQEEAAWFLERIFLGLNVSLSIFQYSNFCSDFYRSEFSENKMIELRKYSCPTDSRKLDVLFFKEQDHVWQGMDIEARREKFKGVSLADSIWNLLKKE
jgi:poly(3-hydroxybutyrate) depolymerase